MEAFNNILDNTEAKLDSAPVNKYWFSQFSGLEQINICGFGLLVPVGKTLKTSVTKH